jgi:hypothetical protein
MTWSTRWEAWATTGVCASDGVARKSSPSGRRLNTSRTYPCVMYDRKLPRDSVPTYFSPSSTGMASRSERAWKRASTSGMSVSRKAGGASSNRSATLGTAKPAGSSERLR